MDMKKELLEYIIRECVKEILEAADEPELQGAPAPPAGDQGTADQPTVTSPEEPNAQITMTPDRGVVLIDPKNPQKKEYIQNYLQGKTGSSLERQLYQIAARKMGSTVQITPQTLRDVPKVLAGNIPVTYLYLGAKGPENADNPNVDPSPDEGEPIKVFSTPRKDIAQKFTVAPESIQQSQFFFDPNNPSGNMQLPAKGPRFAKKTPPVTGDNIRTLAPDIDEGKNLLTQMVREALMEVRKRKH